MPVTPLHLLGRVRAFAAKAHSEMNLVGCTRAELVLEDKHAYFLRRDRKRNHDFAVCIRNAQRINI